MTPFTISSDRRIPAEHWSRMFRAGLLVLALTLLMPLPGVAATTRVDPPESAPAATTAAATTRLVVDLAASPAPAVRFGRLAKRDRQAIVAFLSVASTGTTGMLQRRIVAGPRRAAMTTAPGAGCWTWKWERDAYNLFGLKLWAYVQEIDWCDDGYSIIRDPQVLNYGSTYFPFWSWVHAGDHTWGGLGQPAFRSWSQANFSLCLTPNVGCIQNTYPWLDMTAHANGTGTGSVG